MSEPLRIISFGAGVQTTALAILNATGRVENPARILVFADTGDEKPETYDYLREHLIPWTIGKHDMEIHIVGYRNETLSEYAWRRRMVPSINTRWCTTMFKVRELNRWARQNGATARQPVDMQIGISADESHRMHAGRKELRYIRRRWPLCDLLLTRNDCHAIIREAGLPSPPKSGCYYCPYQARANWMQLNAEHPDLMVRALALEANAMSRNPRDTLRPGATLRSLVAGGTQLDLDGFLEQESGCTSGACFV